MLTRFPRPIQNAALLLACALSAALVAMVFAPRSSRLIIPLLFIAVLVLVAIRYGAMVGVVGSLLVGLIFAYLLYPPLHSLEVQGSENRSQLAWVVLAGIIFSFLLARPGSHTSPIKK